MGRLGDKENGRNEGKEVLKFGSWEDGKEASE